MTPDTFDDLLSVCLVFFSLLLAIAAYVEFKPKAALTRKEDA